MIEAQSVPRRVRAIAAAGVLTCALHGYGAAASTRSNVDRPAVELNRNSDARNSKNSSRPSAGLCIITQRVVSRGSSSITARMMVVFPVPASPRSTVSPRACVMPYRTLLIASPHRDPREEHRPHHTSRPTRSEHRFSYVATLYRFVKKRAPSVLRKRGQTPLDL